MNFFYSQKWKLFKIFGSDEPISLTLLKAFMDMRLITGIKKGFKISQKRLLKDMKFKLNFIITVNTIDWIRDKYNCQNVIYMGD